MKVAVGWYCVIKGYDIFTIGIYLYLSETNSCVSTSWLLNANWCLLDSSKSSSGFCHLLECLGMENMDSMYFTLSPQTQEIPWHYRRRHGQQSMLLSNQVKKTTVISKRNNESTENKFEKICFKHIKAMYTSTVILLYTFFYLLGHLRSSLSFLLVPKFRNILISWLYNL